MALPGPEAPWTAWEIAVSFAASSNLVAVLVFIFWAGRRFGSNEATMVTLRTDLDRHISGDQAMFAHVEDKVEIVRAKVGELAENMAKRDDIDRLGSSIAGQISALSSRVDNAFKRGS